MREYTIRIKETLEQCVTVEAPSMQKAKEIVRAAWENGDYVLDAEHFQNVTFTLTRGL